jgi:hypothetical protein
MEAGGRFITMFISTPAGPYPEPDESNPYSPTLYP